MTATDAQVRIAMRERSRGKSQEQAAAKANLRSRQTIAKYEKLGKAPCELKGVRIPAGEFLYGKGKETVYLEEFYISKYPVTNRQYKVFMNETGYEAPGYLGGWIPDGKENHPVTFVNWYHAQTFCNWAGGFLPTEEQWEKACRGTDGQMYPWEDTGHLHTHPKGAYPFSKGDFFLLELQSIRNFLQHYQHTQMDF